MTYKYEMTYERQPAEDAHWLVADGSDVIKAFINRRGDRMGRVSIEDKLDRLIDVIGRIADEANVNLPELFDKYELDHITFRPNENTGA
jgi:hypothetical protein